MEKTRDRELEDVARILNVCVFWRGLSNEQLLKPAENGELGAVKMGPKFWETVKGKLSVGAKIIKKGGRENIFRDIFGVSDGQKLLKASHCYLSNNFSSNCCHSIHLHT